MKRLPLAERRTQLIDAAMSIAVREGVEAVTIRGVASEAGVSLGVVHYCFEDKDALLQAMGHSLAMVAADPVRRVVQPGVELSTLMHDAAQALWEGLVPRRHMRLLTFEFATAGVRSRALRSVAHAHLEQTWDMTRGILDEIAAIAGITYSIEPHFLSQLVAGYIDGIEIAWLIKQDDEAAIASFHALADYVYSLVVWPEGTTSTRVGEAPGDVSADSSHTVA